MGQITATRNLVAIKVVRHAGQLPITNHVHIWQVTCTAKHVKDQCDPSDIAYLLRLPWIFPGTQLTFILAKPSVIHTCQGYPGYFRERNWLSLRLPEISRATLTNMYNRRFCKRWMFITEKLKKKVLLISTLNWNRGLKNNQDWNYHCPFVFYVHNQGY